MQDIVIDSNKLEQRCLSSIDDFRKEGDVVDTDLGIYIYKNNNSKVLAVAHLDTVIKSASFKLEGNSVISPQLDDRLGAYIILDLLPQLNINCDILLTDGEETHKDTAQFFKSPKQYNWMFNFDRAGTDVVMYFYEDVNMKNILIDSGFKVGKGTCSDISYLKHLGIKGINFGCGYHLQHSYECYASLIETKEMVSKFIPFYKKYKDVRFPHLQE